MPATHARAANGAPFSRMKRLILRKSPSAPGVTVTRYFIAAYMLRARVRRKPRGLDDPTFSRPDPALAGRSLRHRGARRPRDVRQRLEEHRLAFHQGGRIALELRHGMDLLSYVNHSLAPIASSSQLC